MLSWNINGFPQLSFSRLIICFSIYLLSPCLAQDCVQQRPEPQHLKYLSVKVVNKDSDNPSYNLVVESQAGHAGAPYGARFLTGDIGNCSSQCTHRIIAFRPRERNLRLHRTLLYALDFQETMIAPNYQDVEMESPIKCARQFGFCGATIGLYRHFRYTPGGLQHAYSFSSQQTIRGFTREFYPMCYLWTLPDDKKILKGKNILASRSPRATSTCVKSPTTLPFDELELLRVYDNQVKGTRRDHYYTISTNISNPDLSLYNQLDPLGKVATSDSGSCGCLIKLVQVIDKQDGILRRLDHKIIIEGAEPNRQYENYTSTGESFYCAREMSCGATLPLWKSFHYFDIDSILSTSTTPVPYSYLYPQKPLCFIWPVDYGRYVDTLNSTTIETVHANSGNANSPSKNNSEILLDILKRGTILPNNVSHSISRVHENDTIISRNSQLISSGQFSSNLTMVHYTQPTLPPISNKYIHFKNVKKDPKSVNLGRKHFINDIMVKTRSHFTSNNPMADTDKTLPDPASKQTLIGWSKIFNESIKMHDPSTVNTVANSNSSFLQIQKNDLEFDSQINEITHTNVNSNSASETTANQLTMTSLDAYNSTSEFNLITTSSYVLQSDFISTAAPFEGKIRKQHTTSDLVSQYSNTLHTNGENTVSRTYPELDVKISKANTEETSSFSNSISSTITQPGSKSMAVTIIPLSNSFSSQLKNT